MSPDLILGDSITFGGLALFMLLEALLPAKGPVMLRLKHWVTNLSLG